MARETPLRTATSATEGTRPLRTSSIASASSRPRIAHRYPLAAAADAHRDLEARRTTGQLLLLP